MQAIQETIEAIVVPRRREILRLVRETELSAGEIAAHFADVTRPAISQHLRVLREAELIRERRDGTRRLYRARPEGFGGLREFLDLFWEERLQILLDEAELEEKRRRSRERGSRN